MSNYLQVILAALASLLVHRVVRAMFRRKRNLLRGKHVFITGGSKGIGFSIAKCCVEKGSHVTIVARSAKELDDAREQLRKLSQSINYGNEPMEVNSFVADTTDEAQVRLAVSSSAAQTGPIDIMVCNAGLSIPKLCTQTSIDEYQKQIDVNYLGTVRSVQAVLPSMLERRSGHFILVSSVLGVLGFAGYSSYAPSKWAIRGFADCLCNEVRRIGK